MPEILTESFCERCGTKYTLGPAEEPRKPAGVKKARLLARGFKNFVMSDDAFEDALAAAELDEDRERATEQLEAFHQVFNFCMECRQYTCTQCWNPSEGRCLTCAPLPFGIEKDPLFRLGDLAPGAGAVRPPAPDAHPTVVEASAWPTADLARAGANRPTPPADLQPLGLPEWLTPSGAHADAPPTGNGELVGTEQVPQLMTGEAPAPAQAAGTETVAPVLPTPSAPQQVAPTFEPPRDIAAAPEVPLSADIPMEPESAEESAAKAALDELASDVAANAPLPEIAPPPAWAREPASAQSSQPAAAPAPHAAAPAEEPAVPGAAFDVKPTGRELSPSDAAAAEKGRKKTGRGARQQMGPLPGMSWQAWRATVAKREAGEIEEPVEPPTAEQPAHALNEGMILEPIVPDAAEEWESHEPVASEPQPAAPVEHAEAHRAPEQPEETMPASRILERLRGAFGRPHAPQAQPVQPAEEPSPAAQLPDAVGFPEPEPLGQAAYTTQQPFGAPQEAFAPAPPAGGEPFAPPVEPTAAVPAQPAWPPAEPAAEPWAPAVEEEPLELPQAASPQPGERRSEPAPAWQVTPEAPPAPAQEPAWPAAPRQEPAWPAAPKQEPAWPAAPSQEPPRPAEPAWPAAPRTQPAWPPEPARPQEPAWPAAAEPSHPAAPSQEPAWPAAPEREPVWPPRAPVYQPPTAPPPAPSWPPQPSSAPPQPAPPPAFVAHQARGPASWPPAAQSAPQPSASSVWEESSRGIISRPGSGVQACVSCGLALSASARFCRRCGTRQA
jgi:hypothetical protein